MKRLHVHIAVSDLESSTQFYSSLFNTEPAVKKPDYVKWMLDDPRVNFAISNRGSKIGLDHLGIQAENESELNEIKTRLQNAELPMRTEENTACCYAKSNKHWTMDPNGIAWETFHSMQALEMYGLNESEKGEQNAACCKPATPTKEVSASSCC